jgi:hypothetical protein
MAPFQLTIPPPPPRRDPEESDAGVILGTPGPSGRSQSPMPRIATPWTAQCWYDKLGLAAQTISNIHSECLSHPPYSPNFDPSGHSRRLLVERLSDPISKCRVRCMSGYEFSAGGQALKA